MAKTGTTIPTAKQTRCAGTTLAELLVVLAIIGLMSAVLAPRFLVHSSKTTTKTAAMQFANLCRDARKRAMASGISTQVLLDTDNKTAWIFEQPGQLQFKKQIEITSKTAAPESAIDLAGFRFFADGTSTGGEVRFITGQTKYLVRVLWVNGDIHGEHVQ